MKTGIIGKVGGEFGKQLEKAELYKAPRRTKTTKQKGDRTMAKKTKKETKAKGKPGKKRQEVPAKLLSHPVIGADLKKLGALKDDRSTEGAKYRRKLRKRGFSLSDSATWEKFLKSKTAGKTPEKPVKKNDHGVDAVRYMVYGLKKGSLVVGNG